MAKFLVAIHEKYGSCTVMETLKENRDEAEYIDVDYHLVLGTYEGKNKDAALEEASDKTGFNKSMLIAWKLDENE